jgi:SAM-dependent methyltransferase
MGQVMNDPGNTAQIEYWNAVAGETWSQFHDQLDRQIEPLGVQAMKALDPKVGERIVDIGCGCGQTTLALASKVGPQGSVVGVDISRPMLAVARERGAPAGACRPQFRLADVQTADFPGEAFDAAFSRFGVMFFSDPVAAFANIRLALNKGGRLGFVCWRPFEENDWMRVPMEAARPFLEPSPPTDPRAPGPFAFSDPGRVRSILEGAGFKASSIEPFDARVGGAGVEQTLALAFRVGPLGAALRDKPERVSAVAEAVRRAVTAYDTPDGVKMPAAVWIVRAWT